MGSFAWSSEYSVGIEMMDRQHRKIFDMIDRLEHQDQSSSSSETVSEVLAAMIQYADEHFRSEEQLLADHGYPGLAEHKKQHSVFLERAAELNFEKAHTSTDVNADTLEFLRLWLYHHIRHVDKKYGPFLNQRGVK